MYIAVEGIDGVGKTTLIEELKPLLNTFTKQAGLEPIQYIAEKEIKIDSTGNKKLDHEILAHEYEIQRQKLHDQLNWEGIILSDRSKISTYAYQGVYIDDSTIDSIVCKSRTPAFIIFIKNSISSTIEEDNYNRFLNLRWYRPSATLILHPFGEDNIGESFRWIVNAILENRPDKCARGIAENILKGMEKGKVLLNDRQE